jgi:hypothetical protein
MVSEYARRYTAKVAELRKTDLRIDWSEVIGVDGSRSRTAVQETFALVDGRRACEIGCFPYSALMH